MARGLVICAVVTLAGCATPQEQAAREERERAAYREALTKQCENIGYRRDTDPIRQCILTLHGQIVQSQAQNAQPQYQRPRRERVPIPTTTTCSTYYGQTTCQTR